MSHRSNVQAARLHRLAFSLKECIKAFYVVVFDHTHKDIKHVDRLNRRGTKSGLHRRQGCPAGSCFLYPITAENGHFRSLDFDSIEYFFNNFLHARFAQVNFRLSVRIRSY